MKKYFLLIIAMGVIGSLVLAPGCTRAAVDDPDMHEPAGYYINLSGVANPSTLYVPQAGNAVSSKIYMSALYNNGEPVAAKNIILRLTDDIGYFPNNNRTITITTNANGNASTTYYVLPMAREKIGQSALIYIDAYIQTDLNPVSEDFHEYIPILLLATYEEFDTLSVSPQDFPGVPQAGGVYSISISNSTNPTNPISWTITAAPGWVTFSSSSGTTPATVTMTVSENTTGSDRSGTITISSSDTGQTINIDINQDGT